MVEVKVITVTHRNPRPAGRETAPQGDSGEKGLACSASTGHVVAVTEKDSYTHEYACVPSHTDPLTLTNTHVHIQ